jgi:uncharacterized protein (UPF0248 family)
MIPIHELINRIVEHTTKVIPFKNIYFEKGDHYSFQITDNEGEVHTIPFHRVRKVYKDGTLIWSRKR